MSRTVLRVLSLVLVFFAQSRSLAADARDAERRVEVALDRARRPVDDPVCLGWQDGSWVVHRYVPSTGNWSSWPSPASALPKKAVHAVGAHAVAVLDPWQQYSGWLFDLHAQRWTPIPVSPIPGTTNNLDPITAAFLENHLVVWGLTKGPPHGAVLDTGTMRWKPIADAPINVRVRALARTTGEKLYVLGGFGPNPPLHNARFGPQNDGAVYDLKLDEWQKLPEFGVGPRGFYGHAIANWRDRVVVFNGRGGAVLDQAKGAWEPIPATPTDNSIMAACTVADDQMLIWSGRSAAADATGETKACADAAAFDFVTRKWEQLPGAPLAPRYLSNAKSSGRTVTIWGGWDSSERPAEFHRDAATFDLEKRLWQRIPDLPGEVPYALHPGW